MSQAFDKVIMVINNEQRLKTTLAFVTVATFWSYSLYVF